MPTVTYRGSARDLRRALRLIPPLLAGRAADPQRLAQAVQLRLGVRLLSLVQADFVTKSRGGTGKDGVTWAKLSPKTIAARERKAKKGGKKAKSARFAGRYDVLRDTGKLLRSLTPGVEDRPARAEGQVLRPGRGDVIVGTNVPYAAAHQNGTKHTPARQILPPPGRLPPAYEQPLLDAALRGVVRIIELMGRNPRAIL